MKNYNANLLKNNWTKIKRKIILPLWFSKYKPMYESLKLDYDDFESMAGEELTKAISTFDETQSNLFTFCTNVLNRKALTELNACGNTDKRAALYSAETLDVPVSDDDNTLKINIIPNFEVEDRSNKKNIRDYLTKLSRTEKDIIIFKVIGFDDEDIIDTLGITKQRYTDAVKSMQIYEKASLLRRRENHE